MLPAQLRSRAHPPRFDHAPKRLSMDQKIGEYGHSHCNPFLNKGLQISGSPRNRPML